MNPVYLNGSDELGAVRRVYPFGYRVLTSVILELIIGVYLLVRGLQLANDSTYRILSAFGNKSASLLIFLGIACILIAIIEFHTRKQNCIEVCEKGIRGKGSTGLLGYRIQPFQLRYDEIVKVENKTLGVVPGVNIQSKSAEYCAFVRNGSDAVRQISEYAAAWK